MEISSFSRMRSYRREGRTAALLKLVLPRAKDDEQSVFNSFYLSLADCYASLAEKLAECAVGHSQPIVLSVNFELSDCTSSCKKTGQRKTDLVTVRRIHRIRCGNEYIDGEFLDCFDERGQIFIQ